MCFHVVVKLSGRLVFHPVIDLESCPTTRKRIHDTCEEDVSLSRTEITQRQS